MSKTKYSVIIISAMLITIAVYTSLMFLLVTNRNEVFYISYGFTIFSILALLGALLVTLIKPQSLDTAFLNEPYISIAFMHAISQLIFGIWSIHFDDPSWKKVLSVDILFCGTYLVCLLFLTAGITLNKEIGANINPKRKFLLSLQVELKNVVASSPDIQKALNNLIDDIKYSDPMSHDELAELESKIVEKTKEIVSSSTTDKNKTLEKINSLKKLLKKRNDHIKHL